MAWGYRASSYVTSGAGFGGSVASQDDPLVLGAATVVGDRIVVVCGIAETTGTVVSYTVNDNRNSGNYTQDATFSPGTDSNGNAVRLSFFSKSVTVAGTTTVTVHISNPAAHFMFGGNQAAIFTGLQVADPAADVSAGAKGESTTPSSGATGATTAANELVVGGYQDTGWGTTLSVGSGYTLAGKHDNDGGNWEGLLEYKDSGASGGTQTATANAAASTSWRIGAVVYKIAGGGGPSPQTVNPNAIGTAETFFGPTVTYAALLPATIASATVVQQATVTSITGTAIQPDTIAPIAVVFQPVSVLVGAQIVPNTIGTSESVPDPTVKLQVQPATITTGESVPQPIVGAVTAVQHYYSTSFPDAPENPMLEGGRWREGLTHGLDWKNIRTRTAVGLRAVESVTVNQAYGTQDGGPASGMPLFDDSIACLVGTFGADQKVRVTVWNEGTASGWPEIEILLRWNINAHSATGYECLISTRNNYCTITRWGGPRGTTFDDFPKLAPDTTPGNPAMGDVYEASIIGNTITLYLNGTQIHQATDTGLYGPIYTTGNPGYGHNWWNDNIIDAAAASTFGITSFTAQTVNVVSPNGLPTGVVFYNPTVSIGSLAQTVGPATIASGTVVYPPTKVNSQIRPDPITTATQVYPPGAVTQGAAQVVQPTGIASTEQVYPPQVNTKLFAFPDAIPTAEQVYPIQSVTYPQLILAGTILSFAQVYPPSFVGIEVKTVSPPDIPSITVVYAPTIFRALGPPMSGSGFTSQRPPGGRAHVRR